jgi:hypothetical protein
MSRTLLAGSLAAIAVAGAFALPAHADRKHYNKLDTEGKSVGTSWAQTGRFDELTSAGMDDVRLTTGDRWLIRATGDARALSQLRFLVEDGALIVGRLSGPRERYGKAQVEVTAPSLRAVTTAGSGTVDVDRIEGSHASATVAGSGHTRVRRVDAQHLTATLAGTGGLDLAGRSEGSEMTIAGSGRVDGNDFTAGSASVTIAGSGAAQFRSPGAVRATIMGSGTVTVTGTTDCNQTRMGSGRLVCRR